MNRGNSFFFITVGGCVDGAQVGGLSPTPAQHSAAATVPNRGISAQAPHGHSRGFDGAEPSLGG
jgi:hypothetical protein